MGNEKNGCFLVREIPNSIEQKEFRASNFSNAKRSAARSQSQPDSTIIIESLDGRRISVLEEGKWYDYDLRSE